MTVLKDYVRLEATGIWRPAPGAQRRDVYVFLGDASLVIVDKAEQPLAHWSLPAIERLNPGRTPALYAPGRDAGEALEVSDTEMVAAIARVQAALKAAEPKPGRLRLWGGLTLVLALVIGAVLWLPGALVAQADRVVPEAKRSALGAEVLAEIEAAQGRACLPGPGTSAPLATLARQLPADADGAPPQIVPVRGLAGPARGPAGGGWCWPMSD